MTSVFGGIFNLPKLKDILNRIRDKFGYIPMNNPNGYYKAPFMPPIIYQAGGLDL